MTSLPSGHTVHLVEGEELDVIKDKFSRNPNYIRLSPGGWFLPEQFKILAERYFNFKVKPSDVFVITFMKVGTTWTQEIVWTMKHNPNLNHPEGDAPVFDRSPFMDLDMLFPPDMPPETAKALEPSLRAFKKHCPGADPRDGVNFQLAEAIPEPRVIKTHLPLSLLPPDLLDKAKVIYVIRDPRDVVCSYYHHSRLFQDMKFSGTIDEFCDYFFKDDVVFSPYWLHVKEAWEKRHHPNMHIMLYEDMKADITKEIKKLDTFLGTHLTETQIENVMKYTKFEEMQKRDNVIVKEIRDNPHLLDHDVMKADGGFFRQGKTGEGKRKLSPGIQVKMDDYVKKYFDFGLNY